MAGTQQQLDFTIERLQIADENLSAARSRIVDTDIAHEMAYLTSQQIIAQTATAMLAQANMQRQSVLQLLGF
ncbi:MAG: flagellin [Candidatus Poriferisodalaceae bacterium]|jgi:flagellin